MRRINLLIFAAIVLIVVGGGTIVLAATGNMPFVDSAARRRDRLTDALTELAANAPEFSVAVLDKAGGGEFSYKGKEQFDTASVVKAEVLACTLLQAQDKKTALSAEQKTLTGKMIKSSDNDATTALFEQLGEVAGLTRCNKRFGLEETTVTKAWGLTRTTADDQVRLLGDLVNDKSVLGVDSRQYAFDLMQAVNDDQNWGVPSVAKEGEAAPVKNGWDTRKADGGLWAVNSIGRIVSPDRSTNVSVAVLSHGNKSMEDGIALVERVTGLTREYLKY